jgi:phasin family protein
MVKKTDTVALRAPDEMAETAIVTVLKASHDVAESIGHMARSPAPAVEAAKASADGAVAVSAKIHRNTGVDMEKMMKSAEDFMSFSQGNIEAFTKFGQIWAAGVQDMGKTLAATAQAQVDVAVATMKAMSGVKSLKDAVDLHTTLARSSVETVMAETGKLTDASMKLTEQAFAPINARVTLATEKFSRVA